MNFKEAIEASKENNKIRRKIWDKTCHLWMTSDGLLKSYIREAVPFVYDMTVLTSKGWISNNDIESKCIEFHDAIEELRRGNTVRFEEWPLTTYIKMEENKQDIYLSRLTEFNYLPLCQDFVSNDWEIYNPEITQQTNMEL